MLQLQTNRNTLNLNENTFLLFAAQHYSNIQCEDIDEFYADLLTPMHLKKLFTRYHVNGILKERLILNHLVGFFNVFEPFPAVTILFYKLDEKYYSYLKTFLVYMNRCPVKPIVIDKRIIDLSEVAIDQKLLNILTKAEKQIG